MEESKISHYFEKMDVVWFWVVDWEKAKKFYHEVLGLPISHSEEGVWCEFGEEGQTKLAIHKWRKDTSPPREGGGIPAFLVSDVKTAFDELKISGVKCDEIRDETQIIIGTFYDTEGNRIQLVQLPNSG